jgi:hypothetical protein
VGLLCDELVRIAEGAEVTLHEFNRATNYLTRIGIPFDVSFVPATRKYGASFQLTVHINPTKTEVFVVNLTRGTSVFTPSP